MGKGFKKAGPEDLKKIAGNISSDQAGAPQCPATGFPRRQTLDANKLLEEQFGPVDPAELQAQAEMAEEEQRAHDTLRFGPPLRRLSALEMERQADQFLADRLKEIK